MVVLQRMSAMIAVVVLRCGQGVGDGKWFNSSEAEFIVVAYKNYDVATTVILFDYWESMTKGPGLGPAGLRKYIHPKTQQVKHSIGNLF